MFKIIEFRPSLFIIKEKGTFFWHTLQCSNWAENEDRVFDNLESAETFLVEYAQSKLTKKQFVRKTYWYGENGKPFDNWLPPIGLGR